MKHCKVGLVFFIAVCLIVGVASAQTLNDKKAETYSDMLKKDIRTQKQSLVDQSMGLEASQKSQFWAIYEGYQTALNKIWDQRIANINMYADNFDKMTDAVADQLAIKMLDLEGQRTALKKTYYSMYKEKMGARVAARFLQVESTLGAFMDLQIGSAIPILQ
jgi:hypothetical protein